MFIPSQRAFCGTALTPYLFLCVFFFLVLFQLSFQEIVISGIHAETPKDQTQPQEAIGKEKGGMCELIPRERDEFGLRE